MSCSVPYSNHSPKDCSKKYRKNNIVYATPLCSIDYKDGKRILTEQEPKNEISTETICPFNNGCKNNADYTY